MRVNGEEEDLRAEFRVRRRFVKHARNVTQIELVGGHSACRTPEGCSGYRIAFSLHGATLGLLYSCSALYHSFHGHPKEIFRNLDHQSIYLLIAGSYTHFCLVTLRGACDWSLFGIVWGLAVGGGLREFWLKSEAKVLPVVIYVVMGSAVVAALIPLLWALGTAGLVRLAARGLFYTTGIIFYALDD